MVLVVFCPLALWADEVSTSACPIYLSQLNDKLSRGISDQRKYVDYLQSQDNSWVTRKEKVLSVASRLLKSVVSKHTEPNQQSMLTQNRKRLAALEALENEVKKLQSLDLDSSDAVDTILRIGRMMAQDQVLLRDYQGDLAQLLGGVLPRR